jgi:hypothetical protein
MGPPTPAALRNPHDPSIQFAGTHTGWEGNLIMKLKLAALAALVLAAANASACYTVFDANNRVIFQGEQPPVDMSLPLHQTLGRQHPGAHMVFDQNADCRPVTLAQVPRSATAPVPANTIRMERTARVVPVSNAPLLTDRRTAASLNLPHTVLEGQIVMVPAQAAARVNLPTLTVVPATEIARVNPATSVMGAGPLPSQYPARAGETVITEMHNPPLTAVQRGERMAIIQR